MMARRSSTIARLARRVADFMAECDYAQRRMFGLRTNPDAYVADGDKAPEDYAEFLFRSSSSLLREPAASSRAHGRPVG
ncbi:MAG TPA: hypothetical protein VMA97_13995 [Streptosporangiaceae bacterium]|nr:hypothetical protein [Streptosporangiaceae bacterium]